MDYKELKDNLNALFDELIIKIDQTDKKQEHYHSLIEYMAKNFSHAIGQYIHVFLKKVIKDNNFIFTYRKAFTTHNKLINFNELINLLLFIEKNYKESFIKMCRDIIEGSNSLIVLEELKVSIDLLEKNCSLDLEQYYKNRALLPTLVGTLGIIIIVGLLFFLFIWGFTEVLK